MAEPTPISKDDLLRAHLADKDEPCPVCGYNLRGLLESQCPECGNGIVLRAGRDPKSGARGIALVVTAIVAIKSSIATLLLLTLSAAAAVTATIGVIAVVFLAYSLVTRKTRWEASDARLVWTTLYLCGADGLVSIAALILVMR